MSELSRLGFVFSAACNGCCCYENRHTDQMIYWEEDGTQWILSSISGDPWIGYRTIEGLLAIAKDLGYFEPDWNEAF